MRRADWSVKLLDAGATSLALRAIAQRDRALQEHACYPFISDHLDRRARWAWWRRWMRRWWR